MIGMKIQNHQNSMNMIISMITMIITEIIMMIIHMMN